MAMRKQMMSSLFIVSNQGQATQKLKTKQKEDIIILKVSQKGVYK